MASPTLPDWSFEIGDELALSCLKAYVEWHLDTDDTLLSPTLENTHGSFMNLPFKVWLDCDSSPLARDFAQWNHLGYQPSPMVMRCLGSVMMTGSLRDRLLGPSIPDADLGRIAFTRGKCKWGSEYWQIKATKEQLNDVNFERASYKGMIACIVQWYIYHYLAHGNDLVHILYEPGKASGVPDDIKLAIGVMRECLIYPRFGSVRNFWLVHDRMMMEGGKLIGYWREDEDRGVERVYEVLKEDGEATAMLDLLLDLGMIQTGSFTSEYGMIGIQFKHE